MWITVGINPHKAASVFYVQWRGIFQLPPPSLHIALFTANHTCRWSVPRSGALANVANAQRHGRAVTK